MTKRCLILIITLFFIKAAYSQNVGINTTGASPSKNAILDLNTGNTYSMGLLIPHVELGASLTTFNPPMANAVTTKDTGMMVYNMNSAHQPIGYYYWTGSTWINVAQLSGSGTLNYLARWSPNGATLATGVSQDNGSVAVIQQGAATFGTTSELTVNANATEKNAILGSTTVASATAITGGNSQITGTSMGVTGYVGTYNAPAWGGVGVYGSANNNTTYGVEGNNASGDPTGGAGVIGYDYEGTGIIGSNDLITQVGFYHGPHGAGGNFFSSYNGLIGSYNMTGSGGTGILGLGYNSGGPVNPNSAYNNDFGVLGDFGGSAGSANNGAAVGGFIGTTAIPPYYAAVMGASNSNDYGVLGYNTSTTGYGVVAVNSNGVLDPALLVNGYSTTYGVAYFGNSATNNGTVAFYNSANANTVTINSGVTGTSYALTLPTAQGAANTILTNNGSGVLTWSSNPSYVKDSAWLLKGNSGTNPTNNWIGTNDAEALQFKVDGKESGWIDYNNRENTYFGFKCGNLPTATGSNNTAFGYQSLQDNTSGNNNTANGFESLQNNTTGSYNTATGWEAAQDNTTGTANTATGWQALQYITTGSYNTAIGYLTLTNTQIGYFNTALGNRALEDLSTGTGNTALGSGASENQISGNNNSSFGRRAMEGNVSGNYNTAVGYASMAGGGNTSPTLTGSYNIALGDSNLYSLTSGSYNIAIGLQALYNTTNANINIALGDSALFANTTGGNSIALGDQALHNNTTGSNNLAIGSNALSTNTTGTQNTAIGSGANVATNALSNATAIGYNASVSTSNTMVMGNNSVTEFEFNGALMPYYGATYNSGTGGQVLISEGAGAAPQWTNNNSYVKDSAWLLTGNSGTNPGVNFIGTTDNKDVIFKRNSVQSGLLTYISGNTSWGVNALNPANTGLANTAIGVGALQANTSGQQNTATGYLALYYNTTGSANTANGVEALQANTIGVYNTAAGVAALFSNTTGNNNTANGAGALAANVTGSNNTANGSGALANNTSGIGNTALGYEAGGNSTASKNVFIGDSAGASNTTASDNTAIGYNSLAANTTGTPNTAVGYNSLAANTAGANNVAIGTNALASNTTGIENTANGRGALAGNTTGNDNTAMGYLALNNATAANNTAVGAYVLNFNTSGTQNTAIGALSLYTNNTGGNNTASGYAALHANTTGGNNIAIGVLGLTDNTTGSNNTAIGTNALQDNTTVSNNTAVGFNALEKNTTGTPNTSVGYEALEKNTTGANNVAVGDGALLTNTTGSDNTVIGSGADVGSNNLTNATAIGYNTIVTASNSLVLGNGANVGIGSSAPTYPLTVTSTVSTNYTGYEYMSGGSTGNVGGNSGTVPVSIYSAGRILCASEIDVTSDKRLKDTIDNINPEMALTAITKLKPVHFIWKKEVSKDQALIAGFYAQEVHQLIPEAVTIAPGMHFQDEHTLNYDMLTTYAIAAIQAQQKIIDSLRSANEKLQSEQTNLKTSNDALQNQNKIQSDKLDNLQNAQKKNEEDIADLKRMVNSMPQLQASAKQ